MNVIGPKINDYLLTYLLKGTESSTFCLNLISLVHTGNLLLLFSKFFLVHNFKVYILHTVPGEVGVGQLLQSYAVNRVLHRQLYPYFFGNIILPLYGTRPSTRMRGEG